MAEGENELSLQALAALKVWFGFSPGQTLSFDTPSRRTDDCVAALNELVEAGYIVCTPRNKLKDCPLDYSAEPHTYVFARKLSNADVERGAFKILKSQDSES